MTTRFPAFCPSCGFVFSSSLISFSGTVTNISLRGNQETCPECGAWAELPDGEFNVVDEMVEVISATDLTRHRLAAISGILELAKSGELSDAEAVDRLTNEIPELSTLVKRYQPVMKKAFFAFLWAVLGILGSQAVSEVRDDSPSRGDVQQIVESALNQCLLETKRR